MQRAGTVFSESERERIRQAVAEAERGTSGEIVPAVATCSGDYDRAEDLAGLWLGVLGLIALWWFWPAEEGGAWGAHRVGVALPGLALALTVLVTGFLVGAAVASHAGWLRRWLTSRREMERQVERAAATWFVRGDVRNTRARTGMLIYLSLFERSIRVTGDQAIVERVPENEWRQVCDLVQDGLRQGKAADGLCAGIRRCGEILARHFPKAADDHDELSNDLRVIE
jgi:putative membrane protein